MSDSKSATGTQSTPEGVRVIKKYPNRRLYDTTTSAYVKLSELRDLVMAHSDFVVRDARTGEDLTRSILLQILLEEEAAGVPMFTERVLADIIRFYGHAMQGYLGSYLERNVEAFVELQERMAQRSEGLTPEMWAQFLRVQSAVMQNVMGNYVEQSKAVFMRAQEQMARQTEQMLDAMGIRR